MPRIFHPQQVVRRAGQASQVEQVIGRTGEQADGIDGKQDDQCVAEGLIAGSRRNRSPARR